MSLTGAIKTAGCAVLRGFGVDRAFRDRVNRRHAGVVRILSAHRVIDPAGPLSDGDWRDLARGCLSLPEFERRIGYLSARYRPISLSHYVRDLGERKPPPPNAVILTFDDGFRDVLVHALPVLLRHAFPFTVFLTTGWMNHDPRMLTSADVSELAGKAGDLAGWGAHGVTHRSLTALPADEAAKEIEASKRAVEDLAERPVTLFCYPDGKHDGRTRKLLREHGFAGACVTGRTLNWEPVDPLALKRIPFESEPECRFAFRVAGMV